MKKIWQSGLLAAFLLAGLSDALSQNKRKFEDDGCGTVRWSSQGPYGDTGSTRFNLQIREQTLSAAAKRLSIDAARHGGIRVKGWERDEISVKACIQAGGANEAVAALRASAVVIETADGTVRAVAPASADDDYFFAVSYDVRVPFDTDLKLKTNNGGINLSDIRGAIEFDLNNGGAIFGGIAGSVSGKTNNGNLTFNLSGDRWNGDGIDARTNNGSIFINFPEDYSARLEAATRRGNFYVNFPVETERADEYKFGVTLGTGGATIKTQTNNGAVNIKRQPRIEK